MLQSDDSEVRDWKSYQKDCEWAYQTLKSLKIEVQREMDGQKPYWSWSIRLGDELLAHWESDDTKPMPPVSAGEAAERADAYARDHMKMWERMLVDGLIQP